MLTIHKRPFPPKDRTEAGHWEGDLIIGKDQRSAIGTLVERKTRLVRLLHLPRRDGEALHEALKARMGDLPAALLRSITWDQGTEMARHLTIAKSLGAPVYFCDSHSPWQRGSNESPERRDSVGCGFEPHGAHKQATNMQVRDVNSVRNRSTRRPRTPGSRFIQSGRLPCTPTRSTRSWTAYAPTFVTSSTRRSAVGSVAPSGHLNDRTRVDQTISRGFGSPVHELL